jgi:hypothetical protein
MKILDGELKESLYDWPEKAEQDDGSDAVADITDAATTDKHACCPRTGVCLTKQRERIYGADQVTYVHGMV